ncbi:MAG TPA: hypothetical protein VGK23_04885 [Methanomassiliicoccales archaeon]|jgi:hypothetical protein
MPDIRQKVEEDRGLIKKIQLMVPGYRGYRLRDDLRDSDKMLRLELGKRLALQRKELEEFRQTMVTNNPLSKNLQPIGGIINQYKKVEGLLAHGESGYSGISADIRINVPELNMLYEYDAGMVDTINFVEQSIGSLRTAIDDNDDGRTAEQLKNVKMRITGFEEKFDKRISIIMGIGV